MSITRRQVDILRVVSDANRLNVRQIADKLGSPNRLRGDLVALNQKRFLRMERDGKEHIYTITKEGASFLLKYDTRTVDHSLVRLGKDAEPNEQLKEEVEHLRSQLRELREENWFRRDHEGMSKQQILEKEIGERGLIGEGENGNITLTLGLSEHVVEALKRKGYKITRVTLDTLEKEKQIGKR